MNTRRVWNVTKSCSVVMFVSVLVQCTLVCRAESPIEIGRRRELFLDDYLIESRRNLSFHLHHPQRAESVLRPEQTWEGNSLGHVTVFHDDDVMRMYYRGYIKPPGFSWEPDQVMCYAESNDGVHWRKPSLGLIEWDGSTANNIVMRGPEAACMAPFIDSRPGCPADARYKSLGGNPPYALASADGIRWRRVSDERVLPQPRFGLSYWDNMRQKYVAYVRSKDRGMRGIALSTSRDFLNWTEPQNLDYGDAPPEQLYWNTAIPYSRAPHIYLGFPMRLVFEADATTNKPKDRTDCPLLFSRDGFHFDRRYMEAFVRAGLDSRNWQPHANMMALGILSTKHGELSLYLTNNEGSDTSHLQRLVIRTDGFVSLRASYTGGEFITKPIVFVGDQLTLNVSTGAAGSVQVEIQSADGHPLPGFHLQDCRTYYGDSISAPIKFTTKNLSELAGKPIKLRMVMRDADIYAIQFQSAKENNGW